MPYTREEIMKLFSTDEEGRYLHLVLPNDQLGEEVNLVGKKRLELTIDEIVRVKQYANKLYEEARGE